MHLRLRPAAIGLLALVAATGCAGSTGGEWGSSSTTGSTTAAAVGPADGSTALLSTTTTARPDALSSTTADLPPGFVGCLDVPDSRCVANSSAGSAFLQASVVGGTYGFRFVRVGGEVVASWNPEHPFYPASSIKVLQHLHAVRWAAAQPDPAQALHTPIPVYDDSCAGEGTFHREPLGAVLAAMMIESDNQRANAIQDYFGRAAINATAADVVGTADTVLAHRFGCGGPANDPANRSTAFDLSRIFERVAGEEALDAEGTRIFESLMLGSVWPSLESAVAVEGAALGLDPEAVEAFQAAIELHYKAGWWGTNLSIGGLLRFPPAPCERDAPEYAFAVFVDGADAVADGFDVSDVVAVVLREEIRTALLALVDPSCPP
jgi:hypothetical protein